MARPGGSGGGPPISFKTVPGRHRTQKWNVAKTYNYDGDDWGGYDAYDDYGGGYDANPPPPPQQQPQQQPLMSEQQQPQPVGLPSQLPSQMPPQQQHRPPGRQMSFEHGFTDERTQFASSRPPPPPSLSTGPFPTSSQQGSRGVSPAMSATSSSAGKRSAEYTPSGRPRDFTNPEQVPPPLNTQSPRGSPAMSAVSLPAPPSSTNFNNGGAAFPPRQSSMSSSSPTIPEPAPSSAPPGAAEGKALPTPPFIRPSDIYKRMAAERERERRESESASSRASMESASRSGDAESPAPSSTNMSVSGRQQRPLSAVDEGPAGVPEGFGEPVDRGVGAGMGSGGAALPAVAGVSSFGSDWFGGGQQNTSSTTAASDAVSPTSLQTTPIATRAPAAFSSAPTTAIPTTTAADNTTLPSTTFSSTPPPSSQPQPDLAHQPSAGYRSVVNRAFDHSAKSSSIPPTPISRDNSQSTTVTETSSVSRSNTDSTSNISPIMSGVPSSGTAAQRQAQQQQQQVQEVPTIDEEPHTPPRDTSASSSTGRDLGIAAAAGAAGAAAVGVAAGYRRNYDPPSSGNSPARTPEIGNGVDGGRRLSEGLAAETVTSTDAPSAPVVTTGVESAIAPSTSTSTTDPSRSIDTTAAAAPTPTLGRARAGTDYSTRESDIADAVNNVPSPEQPDVVTMSPTEAAHAEKAEQNLFLRTHNASTPTTPSQIVGAGGDSPFGLPSPGIPRAGTPGSGRASPARGVGMGGSRVREMASKFQEIHDASRRNSQVSLVSTKSSWSRFGADDRDGAGSARGVGAKRQGTTDSNVVSESDYDNEELRDREGSFGVVGGDGQVASPVDVEARPELGGREASFRPNLPGGWISYRDDPASSPARTPASPAAEEYSPIVPPPDTPVDDDDKSASGVAASRDVGQDLTTPRASYEASATRDEVPDLTPTTKRTIPPTTSSPSHFDQAKTAGTALGASLVASYGLGHQTADFGSTDPAPAVDQPEMKPRAAIGEIGYGQRPALETRDTDATGVTDVTSASVPPTPPAKNTPPPQSSSLGGLAGLPSQQRGALTPDQGQGQGYYFSGAPLRTGRSREGSPDPSRGVPTPPPAAAAAPVALPLGAGFVTQSKAAPGMSPSLSLHPRSTDMESDRLRKEIVRSLEASSSTPQQQRQKEVEDAERTQDALDAPENARRVAAGGTALPAAEATRDISAPPAPAAATATPQMSTPQRMMLDQRFSFEANEGELFGGAFGVAGASAAAAAATGLGVTGAEKGLPPPPTVMEPPAEPSPEIKPEMPYERPRSRGLHIMNADEDDDIGRGEDDEGVPREDVVSRGLSVATSSVAPPVSPITKSQENLHLRNVVDATRAGDDGLAPPSPVSEGGSRDALDNRFSVGRNAPEVYNGDTLPSSTNDADTATTTPTSPTSKQKIPPFREILAIKSSADRIKTYDDTRRTFADMNTGLSDWLSGMLAAHPEHASLSTPHGGYNYGASPAAAAETLRHRQSPSLAKFTRQFSSSGSPTAAAGEGGVGGVEGQKTPSKEREIDMEKLQQRGKDLMKNASVLGGKAQAGAKGLLAKGKSRFGSTRGGEGRRSKDPSPSVSASASSSTLVSNSARAVADPTTDSAIILQPTPLSALHLSRSNSRSSSFFRPSRSHNQTPSSISSGTAAAAAAAGVGAGAGPLSRTLSRLRDRSRSLSRSNSRRSSRPRSLILGNADLLSIQDTSPRADEKGGTGVLPLAGSPLISPWIEPDTEEEVLGEVKGGLLPGRLGVLPSPTGGSFSMDLPVDGLPEGMAQEGERGVAGGEVVEGGEGEAEAALLALDTTSRDFGMENAEEGRDELYESTPVIENAAPDLGGEDQDERYDTTPKAARRADMVEEEVDEDTPKAGQGEWRADLAAAPNAEDVLGASGGVEEPQMPPTDRDAPVLQPETHFDDEAGDAQDTLQQPPVTVLHAPPTVISEGGSDGSILSAGRKSDVSEEVRPDNNEDAAMGSTGKPPSIRSAVSSVEVTRDMAQSRGSENEQPVMSSRAVPAGPVSSDPPVSRDGVSLDGITPGGQDFTNRNQYLSRPEIPRQLSFEQMPQDADGEVKQDVLEAPRDLQANTDLADDDRPFEANFTTLTRHRKPSGTQSTDRRSKRLSGFLGGQTPPPSRPLQSMAPSASMISDEYGLEGVQDLHDVPDTTFREEEGSQKDEKEGRRKSGIWDSFRRTPSTSNAGLSREPSVSRAINPGMNDNYRGISPQAPSNIRPEPQRASTMATEPGGKRKSRLSGLGSLFGRSSTTGHKSEKGHSKKLSKSQQPDRRDSWQRQQTQQQQQQQQPPPPAGRIGGTEVFMVPQGPRPGWSDPYMQDARQPPVSVPPGGWYAPTDERPTFPGPPPRQGPPQNFSHPSGSNTRGGFEPRVGMDPRAGFDPRTGAEPRAGLDPRPVGGPQGAFDPPGNIDPRPMGMDPRGIVMDPRRGMQFSNVPESFRPVDASYNRPPGMPMRPSDFPRPQPVPSQSFDGPGSFPPGSRMSYPQPTPPGEQQLRPDVMRQRQSSNASTEYSLSPQISGQSEWQRSGWQHRSSLPAISPVDSRPGLSGPPPARVESITEEAARSPAREYSDQQTPYNLALPPSNGQAQSTRTSYWARQRRSQQPDGYRSVALHNRGYSVPLGANAYEPSVPRPPSRSNAANPMEANYPPHLTTMSSRPPISSFDSTRGDSYLSAPNTQTGFSRQEEAARLSSEDYATRMSREEDMPSSNAPLSQGIDHGRREESGDLPSTQKKDESDNPYLSVQLPNLGNTTKDSPSDDEDPLVFRGASYPGQEWIPAEWE